MCRRHRIPLLQAWTSVSANPSSPDSVGARNARRKKGQLLEFRLKEWGIRCGSSLGVSVSLGFSVGGIEWVARRAQGTRAEFVPPPVRLASGRGRGAMALTDDEAVASLSPEFQGLLDARKVGKHTQAELFRLGVDTMQMFSAVAVDRDGLALLAKDSLGIDPSTTPGDAIKLASLFLAWQSAGKRVKVQDELDADHSAQKMPKAVPASEMLSLKDQFEKSYYNLREAETPAKTSFEDLCEQLDGGELRPMALRHYGSRADDEEPEVGALQLGKSGQVRIKNKIETAVPTNAEDLRLKITLMGNHWLYAKFRYPNKASLQGLTPFTFMEYINYLMGKHVAQMESQKG